MRCGFRTKIICLPKINRLTRCAYNKKSDFVFFSNSPTLTILLTPSASLAPEHYHQRESGRKEKYHLQRRFCSFVFYRFVFMMLHYFACRFLPPLDIVPEFRRMSEKNYHCCTSLWNFFSSSNTALALLFASCSYDQLLNKLPILFLLVLRPQVQRSRWKFYGS